jgi:uncharacterized membrane protein
MEKVKNKLSEMNNTTAGVTTIGGASGVLVVFLLQSFGMDIDATTASALTGAVAVITNFLVPKKG